MPLYRTGEQIKEGVIMFPGVTSTKQTGSTSSSATNRPSKYIVSKGETLTSIAKKFNLTYKEFMAWTGLKSEKTKVGQVIELPVDKILPGKGLNDIAKKNGMTLKEFCSLNNISENYRPRANEQFYVRIKSSEPKPAPAPTIKTTTTPDNSGGQTIKAYDSKHYPVIKMPSCGYIEGNSKNPNVSKNGKIYVPLNTKGIICAEVIKFAPQNKGALSGYTIMVNAGHGFGRKNTNTPILKPGAEYKDANGKTLSEWYKNRNHADELIKELTSRGATVIYTTGDAREVIAAKSLGRPNLLISLHCDAAENSPKANGLRIMYASKEKDSKKFAVAVDKELSNKYNEDCSVITDKDSSHRYIGILHGENGYDVPAVLCEMGFMSNKYDIKNIDSQKQRKIAADCIAQACEAYLKH